MKSLLRALRLKRKKIVILMDEYDAQLAANINNPELYETFRTAMRELYGVMKGDPSIRFLWNNRCDKAEGSFNFFSWL